MTESSQEEEINSFTPPLKRDFTQVQNELIRSPSLSCKAFKLLCIGLSHSGRWKFIKRQISTCFKEGKYTVDEAMKELRALGYLHLKAKPGKGNLLNGYMWFWFRSPLTEEEFKLFLREPGFQGDGDLRPPQNIGDIRRLKGKNTKTKKKTTTEESPEINPPKPKPKPKNKNKNSSSSSDYCVKKEEAIKHLPLSNQTKYNLQRFSLEILTYAAKKLPKKVDSIDRYFFSLCMRLEDGTQSMEEKSSSTEATVASVKSTVQDMFKEVEFPEEYRVEFVKTGYHLFQGHSIAATVGYGEEQCIQATEKIIKYLKEQNVTG